RGRTVAELSLQTGIDPWFLDKMRRIVELQRTLATEGRGPEALPADLLREAKACGFSDEQIGRFARRAPPQVTPRRQACGILPVVKQIDTLAAEWPVRTNYLYVTYHGTEDDLLPADGERKVLVLGSGAYRIGSSVEFDWCSVSATS